MNSLNISIHPYKKPSPRHTPCPLLLEGNVHSILTAHCGLIRPKALQGSELEAWLGAL